MYLTLKQCRDNFSRLSGILVLVSLPQLALSQDNVGEESTVVYPASYFAEYSPVTVQDMLNRIPGVGSAIGGSNFGGGPPSRGVTFGRGPGSGGRGFGGGESGGSEILVNGKRTAGKNNSTTGLLDRITAEQVDYIEIIRGTSGDLDVRGSGQVVNVILFEEISSTNISYEASVERYLDHKTEPGGSLAFSGQSGGLNYLVSAAAIPGYDNSISKENSILGDFTPNDLVREERVTSQTNYELSTNLDYEFNSANSVRFNAQFSEGDNPFEIMRYTTDLRIDPNALSVEREGVPGELDNWEIGGDYEYLGSNGNRFKLLFISNETNKSSTRERFEVLDDGSEVKNLFLDTASVAQERIMRGSYTFDVRSKQDIEFGIERAQTVLDSNLALGLSGELGIPSDSHGGLVPVEVSNANSKVEEIRYEPFLIHNWVINPSMSLESTLLYEESEITQTGDVSTKRDFSFVKPKVDFRYDLTPQLQLRASIEKVVNQLSFADFVASNDDQDDDSNTQAGNENLTQEWLWEYVLNAEYRLPNDVGVIDGGIFYHEHHDVIERIDVTVDEDNLQSANGNIGDGEMWGMNFNASIRMRMINLPNLLLTATLRITDSTIEDPFLLIDRRFQFQARGFNSIGFRHDIPSWNINWGGQFFNRHDGNIKRYDIDDIELAAGDPTVVAFVEYIDRRGITYRLDANSLFSDVSCRERQRFIGRMSAGILEEIEDKCTSSGRTLSLSINGTF